MSLFLRWYQYMRGGAVAGLIPPNIVFGGFPVLIFHGYEARELAEGTLVRVLCVFSVLCVMSGARCAVNLFLQIVDVCFHFLEGEASLISSDIRFWGFYSGHSDYQTQGPAERNLFKCEGFLRCQCALCAR